jgi:hypothetical protein
MEPLDTLVSKLQKANWAYHNGGDEVMTDDEYDLKLEELKRRCPTHPFLKVIGAPVSKGGVILPVILGSLDKIRYGEGTLEKWMLNQKENQYIVSEKLDGLSALYVCDGKGKRMMYLRGDGVKGVDVSRIFEILSFPPHKCIVRGELVLPLEATKEGSIGRSLVNGWLHRILDKKATVPEELKGVHFVAYQLFSHVRTRVDIWLNPWDQYTGRGYQPIQALFSLANGGMTGTGLGLGEPGAVPAAHNDFIFAALGEELGLLGAAAILSASARSEGSIIAARNCRATIADSGPHSDVALAMRRV